MKTLPDFKIRASGAGQIMTDPKGKSNLQLYYDAKEKLKSLENQYENFKNKECKTALEIINFKIPETKKNIEVLNLERNKIQLSDTSKTFAKDWIKEHIYGLKKEIKNKYISKGLKLEDIAIDKVIEWLDLPFAIKNEKFFEDEFFTGTPDLITNDEVLDIKCSWDCFTFPLFEKEIPTKDYFFQLQVYMHLTGLKKARLVYVLLNAPDELTYEEKHNYDNLDKKYRIKIFSIDYDDEVIKNLKQRVINVREYIKTIEL